MHYENEEESPVDYMESSIDNRCYNLPFVNNQEKQRLRKLNTCFLMYVTSSSSSKDQYKESNSPPQKKNKQTCNCSFIL